MSYFYKRLRNRKGFTMIELIIVIAIIGILLAMILPGLFSSDKPTKAKGYAKTYFYTVQDFLSRMKMADDPSNPTLDPLIGDFYLYTTVERDGTITESGMVAPNFSTMTDSATYAGLSAPSQALKDLVTKFARDMEMNLTTGEYAGTFYVVFDSDYVVRGAYWSDGLISDMTPGNSTLLFNDDNQISGYLCCAYPLELSEVSGVPDRSMFRYTY